MDLSTILVIESDNVTRRLMNQLLTARGFDVLEASNLDEANALASQNVPQLAIVYFGPQHDDRLSFSRGIHHTRGTPILALVNNPDDVEIPRLVNEGVMATLCKPFEAEQLYLAVHTAIQLGARATHAYEKLCQLENALAADRDTSIATGLFMERFRADSDQAFSMLRDYARTRRRRIHDLANDIVQAANLLNGPSGTTNDAKATGNKKTS